MTRVVTMIVSALLLAGCGGGGGGDAGEERTWFPPGGMQGADGTWAYCNYDDNLGTVVVNASAAPWPWTKTLQFINNAWGAFSPDTEETIPFDGVAGKSQVVEGEQCILGRRIDQDIEYGWRWNWPRGEGTWREGEVKSYPSAQYGVVTPDLPRRISDIKGMMVRYDFDIEVEGNYNIAWDILANASGRFEEHREILVVVDLTDDFIDDIYPWVYNPDDTEEVTIDGKTYLYWFDLSDPPQANEDENYHIFVPVDCPCPADRYSGTIDLAPFLYWLVDRGHIPPSYHVLLADFGNEVIEGTGEVWLRDYKVTVR